MRVILRCKKTQLYLKRVGDWIALEEDAYVFSDVTNAFQFCSKHGLKDISVVLKFGAGLEDLALNPPQIREQA